MTQHGGPSSWLKKNDQSEQDLPDDVKIPIMSESNSKCIITQTNRNAL
jgi:hypothetical protein